MIVLLLLKKCIWRLPHQEAAVIRVEAAHALLHAKPPKPNLPRVEFNVLSHLRHNKDIVILPADKGNATVVMNSSDYHSKIITLLDDPSYQPVKKDPLTSWTNKKIKIIDKTSLPKPIKGRLKPNFAHLPRLYGLPKIHQNDSLLRPIVSTIGAPSYKLSKYVAAQLSEAIHNKESFVRDSRHFVQLTADLTMTPSDVMVSYDVVSLFTRVPINDTLYAMKHYFGLDDGLINLTEFCVRNNFFSYDGVA